MNAADIVVTKDGNIIRGKILKYSDEELVIIIDEVNTLTFKSSEIKSVDFDNTQNSNLNSKEKINHSFGVLGITLGVPGGVNITGGFYGKTFGTRFSLGAIPQEILAFQALIEYPIYAEKNVFFCPTIPFGYVSVSNIGSGAYTGFGFDSHIYGFTAFVGYGVSLSTGAAGGFLFDIGYKYAWN